MTWKMNQTQQLTQSQDPVTWLNEQLLHASDETARELRITGR